MTAATAVEQPLDTPRRFRALRAHQLDPRDNSLNAVRLLLALLVLGTHSFTLTGAGVGPQLHGKNMGSLAVFGFFAVSGYLISGSRFTNTFGTYLLHRLARIMPAYWVCLVVIAGFFAPIGYWKANGTLDGFLTTPRTPLDFVISNWFLRVSTFEVAGTPTGVPYPLVWDGSLWSLYVEFVCYLVIGALGFVSIVRRSATAMGVLFATSVLLWANNAVVLPYMGNSFDSAVALEHLPFFLGGGLVYALRRRVPLHWAGMLLAGAVGAFLLVQVDDWGMQAAAPFLTYVIMWVASVVPIPRLMHKHDISYGFYIYAFPVQQLFVMFGLNRWGFLVYVLLCVLGTIPLALASWLLVERPVMRRARRSTATRVDAQQPAVPPVALDAPPTPGPTGPLEAAPTEREPDVARTAAGERG